jgi:Protein of unknown function (DUF3592)
MAVPSASSGPVQRWAGTGCLIFFALFWSGMTLTFDIMIGWNAVQQIRALSYATAPGVITLSEIETHPGRHNSTYSAKLRYSYQVAGAKLVGEKYRYGVWSSNDGTAQRTVAALPVGKPVTVHYSPSDPSDAVLVTGLEGMDLFIAMFMAPFNLIMLGIWYAALVAVWRRGKQPLAGGAKVWDDGFRIQVRLAQFSAAAASIAFAGVIAFLAVFAVGFTKGFNPPLNLMLIVWSGILGGALLVFVWRSMRLAAGDSDLVIDLTHNSVTLPRNFGRNEDVIVPLNKIQAIEVERVAQRGPKGSTTYQFFPTIVYYERDNTAVRAKLAQWPNGTSAEALAAWLREKLELKPGASDIA